MTKYTHHLEAIALLEKDETYIFECKREDIVNLLGIKNRKGLKASGKVFSCGSYTCIPPSTVRDHIYIIRVLRRA